MIVAKEVANSTRIKKGYSISKLAREIKMTRVTVQNIFNNNAKTTPETAKKICDVLDVEFDEIFKIQEDNNAN